MQDIDNTIGQYVESATAIRQRIHELNTEMNGLNAMKDSLSKQLLSRRSILYTELCGIEYALRELIEYQNAVLRREVKLKIG